MEARRERGCLLVSDLYQTAPSSHLRRVLSQMCLSCGECLSTVFLMIRILSWSLPNEAGAPAMTLPPPAHRLRRAAQRRNAISLFVLTADVRRPSTHGVGPQRLRCCVESFEARVRIVPVVTALVHPVTAFACGQCLPPCEPTVAWQKTILTTNFAATADPHFGLFDASRKTISTRDETACFQIHEATHLPHRIQATGQNPAVDSRVSANLWNADVRV